VSHFVSQHDGVLILVFDLTDEPRGDFKMIVVAAG